MKIRLNDKELEIDENTNLAQLLCLSGQRNEELLTVVTINSYAIKDTHCNIFLHEGDEVMVYPLIAGG